MTKNLRNASPTAGLLLLALASAGCGGGAGSGQSHGTMTAAGSNAIPGAQAGQNGVAGVGHSATGLAGSSTSGGAARGAVGSGGVGGVRTAAGSPGTGIAGALAGSGNAGGMRGVAGASGSSSAGARAAGSGGSGGAATARGGVWLPKPGVTWQWQLTGTLDTNVDVQMYDIDLFTSSTATIQELHTAGRIVVCYFSAGSYEPGRPDSDALSKTGLGSTLDGWPDEKWLDIRSTAVRELMKGRLDLAKSHGCDGVEPDNVDGFDNDNGLGLTEKDQVDYNRFLANEAHARGLSVGLKNCLGLVPSLVSSFDWALDEECLAYSECETLEPFISAGKAVFHCEYAKTTEGICGETPQGFSTIVKNLDLDAFRLACD